MAKRSSARKKRTPRYSSDRPIKSEQEDRLGRVTFAKSLADDIRAWNGRDSLVIALYGGWGCGKTSIKNLLVSRLAEGRSPLPVLEFNPWQFSGTGNIVTSFFAELGIALDTASAGKAEKAERAERLDRYAKRLTFGGSTVEAIGTALSIVGVPGSGLVALAGKGLKSAGAVTQEGSATLKAEVDHRSLTELKAELAESLACLKRPLLVVIDDIDRLTTAEIREVLQLVKANADFPNLIYLLLCERSIVSGALNSISGDRGTEFLEKIVQVGYNVPQVTSDAVQKVLLEGLNECLSFPGIAARWDKNRWYELLTGGLAFYFQNLRHVYRFLASFDFHVRQFQRGESFEVNPVDLIALEVLRVFEPAVYEQLPSAKRILTRDEGHRIFDEINQGVIESAVTQILAAAPEGRRTTVRGLLQLVFPPITLHNEEPLSSHRESWLRDARVCHPELFDKYFTLVIAQNDLSQTELDRLVGLAGNRHGFTTECLALHKRGLLHITFKRLDAFKNVIPLNAMQSLTCALCDICDQLEDQEGEFNPFSQFDPLTIAWWLVFFGLRREPDRSKRFEILKAAFTESTGIYLAADIVRSADRANTEEDGTEEPLLNESDIPPLKRLIVQKIRVAAETGVFETHLHAHTLLRFWQHWSPDEARAWIVNECTTPEKAAWLLSLLMLWASSNGQVKHYIQLSFLAKWGDVAKFEELVGRVNEAKLPEKQKTALKEFHRALQRQKEGKPEMDGETRLKLKN